MEPALLAAAGEIFSKSCSIVTLYTTFSSELTLHAHTHSLSHTHRGGNADGACAAGKIHGQLLLSSRAGESWWRECSHHFWAGAHVCVDIWVCMYVCVGVCGCAWCVWGMLGFFLGRCTCVYGYVGVYISVHVCVGACEWVCGVRGKYLDYFWAGAYVCLDICVCMYQYICVWACVSVRGVRGRCSDYFWAGAHVCVDICVCAYQCVDICVCVYQCVDICVCVYQCMCVWPVWVSVLRAGNTRIAFEELCTCV